MRCGMNEFRKPTLRQKWRGFIEFLHRPKTKFDIRDRSRALLLYIIVAAVLMWLVGKLTG